jgi:transposase
VRLNESRRESAVKLVNEKDKPATQTARELGINEIALHTWIVKAVLHTVIHLYEVLKGIKKLIANDEGFLRLLF